MKIFLAGTGLLSKYKHELLKSKYILESFYSIKEWQIEYIRKCEMFLLDSGAFTFMSNKKQIDWNSYVENYIKFINKYDIKNFFELDVDNILGYAKVKEIRKRIENETGKKVIPVWHRSRGKSEFIKMCEEYDYVAIGGIVSKEIVPAEYKYFPWFIKTAHAHGAKIHGLGFTSTPNLKSLKFDSVDSTTWLNGGRYGNICRLQNNTIVQDHYKNMKCVRQDELMLHNYNIWIKFQRYAERNL